MVQVLVPPSSVGAVLKHKMVCYIVASGKGGFGEDTALTMVTPFCMVGGYFDFSMILYTVNNP